MEARTGIEPVYEVLQTAYKTNKNRHEKNGLTVS